MHGQRINFSALAKTKVSFAKTKGPLCPGYKTAFRIWMGIFQNDFIWLYLSHFKSETETILFEITHKSAKKILPEKAYLYMHVIYNMYSCKLKLFPEPIWEKFKYNNFKLSKNLRNRYFWCVVCLFTKKSRTDCDFLNPSVGNSLKFWYGYIIT